MSPTIPAPAAPPRPGGRRLLYGTIVSDGVRTANAVLAVDGARIVYAGPADRFNPGRLPGARVEKLPPGSLILPGLVDLHCHGAFGGDFPSGAEAASRRAIDLLHRSGTTTLLASLVTASREDLLRGVGVHAALSAEGLLAGIHLEGPFLSRLRCGAQNPAFLREPDSGLLAELVAAGHGTLATMTYAPELPGAAALVAFLARHGIVPSLGHTDCDGATASASLAAAREGLLEAGFDGVRARPTVTHLFNAMPPLHHRTPGAVGACLRSAASGAAVVELIADGSHLDPFMVSTVFQLVGAGNIALVTDSMAAAGLPDGPFRLGPAAVTVRNGVATLDATGALAGGTATLLAVVSRAVAAGVVLEDAVRSASAIPAAVLGLAGEVGSLRRGLRADVLVVDAGLGLRKVMRGGQWLAPHS
ncbi:N-acetylglucosamine-6-phosphate deacetylase [Pseudarthrobacter sp. MM222]|uniref:N-acetylglucosamine-6-phosphate deacetylase n=1 Tax=Pseudarthrobacter sp. MM222 TaxID=3018929 RepID=UPI0022210E21|nr:amidohydrolase family protein [Pseudarthrobacter sp. MM222]CAI3800717.1 N-acetylglucosamine-6-phosphate deacetylase [Pseudarthrobacter sp. MM222]